MQEKSLEWRIKAFWSWLGMIYAVSAIFHALRDPIAEIPLAPHLPLMASLYSMGLAIPSWIVAAAIGSVSGIALSRLYKDRSMAWGLLAATVALVADVTATEIMFAIKGKEPAGSADTGYEPPETWTQERARRERNHGPL